MQQGIISKKSYVWPAKSNNPKLRRFLDKMVKQILPRIIRKAPKDRLSEIENNLIRHEAKLTKNIFGPTPKGHAREFFCLDKNTWIWHEEWDDENNVRNVISTKYFIRPEGTLKSQNGGVYKPLDKTETKNLYNAIKQYTDIVLREYKGIEKNL